MASEDTEITLGTGKLLGLFLLLAAICGVFFAIGYSLGKTSATDRALNDQAAATAAELTHSSPANKPAAGTAKQQQASSEDEQAASQQPSLTFYKSVQQSQPDTQLSATTQNNSLKGINGAGTLSTSAPAGVGNTEKPASSKTAKLTPAAEDPRTSVAPEHAYMVQVAAVSKQDDAAVLAGALKKKSYDVIVVTNPAGTDKLFHVQVGPFASLQDAEAMKSKLMGDGYNAIVKR